jgi:hypothetical protein
MKNRFVRLLVGAIGIPLLVFGGFFANEYASTPAHIRNPKFEHYHFRTQIVVYGEAVDFSKDRYQKEYDGDTCSDQVLSDPIHFHDHIDQMTHIHWDGITGGEFMKYYGWNYIGGNDDTLGQRYDQGLLSMNHVKIYGHVLPILPEDANFFVYIGDQNVYQQKSWNDFLRQNLEDFFGKKSLLKRETSWNLKDLLLPKASAHGEIDDGHDDNTSEEDLTRINNLIGNVVIFAQKQAPTDEEVKARFNNLAPLYKSACGG